MSLSSNLVQDALDDIKRVENNLPPEPKTHNHTVGGYFYNQWTPEYANWVKMRGALAHARRSLEQALEGVDATNAESA